MTTAQEVKEALELLDGLTVAAADLRARDRIVYRRHGEIIVSRVLATWPAELTPGWVTIETEREIWSCSPRNRGQYRIADYEPDAGPVDLTKVEMHGALCDGYCGEPFGCLSDDVREAVGI